MTDEVDEMSAASRGSVEWSDASGSKAERLHDLGMVVGYCYSSADSLREAICLAEALGLVDSATLATMKAAWESLDGLKFGELSKARVVEVFQESACQQIIKAKQFALTERQQESISRGLKHGTDAARK